MSFTPTKGCKLVADCPVCRASWDRRSKGIVILTKCVAASRVKCGDLWMCVVTGWECPHPHAKNCPLAGQEPLSPATAGLGLAPPHPRSEERHVGKECRSRWSPY